MASRDLQKEVTDRIVAKLASGVVPWRKPWNTKSYGTVLPRNAATKRGYSGVNLILLWMTADERGYASNEWLTYKQAVELNGNVKKGERGTGIIFVSFIEDKKDPKKRVAFLKSYTVFNVEQCENLKISTVEPKFLNSDEREDIIDDFLTATGADIRYEGSRAYYSPVDDHICIPLFDSFKDVDHFYNTTFHELIHWTGHKSRLDRIKHKSFGDETYSGEELIAELGASFLCAEFGFSNDDDAASYIDHWIKFLTDHPKAIMAAASAASKAVEHLRGVVVAEETETLSEAA